MITLAFAQMLYFFFIALQKYGGEDGLQMQNRSHLGPLDLDDKLVFYYLVLAILLLALFLCRRLVASRFGMVHRRVRDRTSGASGRSASQPSATASPPSSSSGAIAGLAGVLLANSQTYVSPADMAWARSGELIVMVVLGGMGTLVGPVIGAVAYLLLELAARRHYLALAGDLRPVPHPRRAVRAARPLWARSQAALHDG